MAKVETDRYPRLRSWFKGDIPDDDLTMDEIAKISELLMDAIAEKLHNTSTTKFVFQDHGTIQ